MKINNLLLAVFCIFALSAVSCSEKEPEKPQSQPEEPDALTLQINVRDISDASAFVDVTASHEESTYYSSVISLAEYDLLGGDDESLMAEDKEFFKYLARKNGKSYEQVIEYMLNTGSREEKFINLYEDTEYIAYAYEMNSEGEVKGGVSKCSFRTEESAPSPITFTIEKEEIGDTYASFLAKPSTDTVWCTSGFVTDDIISQYGGNIKGIKLYAKEYLIQQAEFFGFEVTDIIDILCKKGEFMLSGDELSPETVYYAYTVAVDMNGNAISDVGYYQFTTPKEGMIDFNIDIRLVEYNNSGAEFELKTSDGKNTYFYRCYPSETVDKFSNDDEFIEWVIEDEGSSLRHWLVSGNTKTTVSGQLNDSDYYMIAFGYSEETGRNNTPLFKLKFTTPVPEVDFNIQVELIKMGVLFTIDPSDNSLFYVYGMLNQNEYDEFGGSIQQYFKQQVETYLSNNPESSRESAIKYFGGSGEKWATMQYLYSETKYYVWAAAVNRDGDLVSEIATKEFMSKKHTYNESDYVEAETAYYDGNDVAKMSFLYKDYADCAVMSVSVEKSSEDVSWVSGFYLGDLENDKETYTDDMIRYDLINYKSSTMTSDPVYVLPWDTEITLCIATVNQELECGQIYRKVMKLTKENAGDASNFTNLYNFPIVPDLRFGATTSGESMTEASAEIKPEHHRKATEINKKDSNLADRETLRKSESVRFMNRMVKERLFKF